MACASVSNDMASIKNERALCNAARSGDCEMIAKLLSLIVSVEAENWTEKLYYSRKNWKTPLQIAAANGHITCVQLLLANGANVDAIDKFHYTPLHFAAKNGNYQCLRALLHAGAKRDAPLLDHPGSPHVGGTTALHLATKYNHVDCVKELINSRVNCNAVDGNGHTSLYIAAKSGFYHCVLAHLENNRSGPAVFVSLSSFDTSDTPLHFAVKYRMLECVKKLVRLGSDIYHINRDGSSPFHLLCCEGNDGREINLRCWKNDVHKRIQRVMYEDADFTDFITPQAYIDRNCSIKMEMLKCFLREGHNVDINIAIKQGITALYHSVFLAYNPEIAVFLIANGARIDIKNKNWDLTILEHELSIEASPIILKCLVKCMSQLPHLRSLNIKYSVLNAKDSVHAEGYATWRSQDLPKDMEFRLVRDKTDIYVEMRDRKLPLTEARSKTDYGFYRSCLSVFPSTRYRLEEPLLSLVSERVVDEIKQLDDYLIRENMGECRALGYKRKLVNLEKCLWYEIMATNPRTLQDCCRVCIRKCMGPSIMKHIRYLPLPKKVTTYLLLDCDV